MPLVSRCGKCGGSDWGYTSVGYRYCKACNSRRAAAWHKEHPIRSRRLRQESHARLGNRWWQKNKPTVRWYGYKQWDSRHGLRGTLPKEEALALMQEPCTYCGKPGSGGLDQVLPGKGHTRKNVTPCCVVCNHILTDLPPKAKNLIASGLKKARKSGALDQWTPPIRRRQAAS
jgi:hypothetical protein